MPSIDDISKAADTFLEGVPTQTNAPQTAHFLTYVDGFVSSAQDGFSGTDNPFSVTAARDALFNINHAIPPSPNPAPPKLERTDGEDLATLSLWEELLDPVLPEGEPLEDPSFLMDYLKVLLRVQRGLVNSPENSLSQISRSFQSSLQAIIDNLFLYLFSGNDPAYGIPCQSAVLGWHQASFRQRAGSLIQLEVTRHRLAHQSPLWSPQCRDLGRIATLPSSVRTRPPFQKWLRLNLAPHAQAALIPEEGELPPPPVPYAPVFSPLRTIDSEFDPSTWDTTRFNRLAHLFGTVSFSEHMAGHFGPGGTRMARDLLGGATPGPLEFEILSSGVLSPAAISYVIGSQKNAPDSGEIFRPPEAIA